MHYSKRLALMFAAFLLVSPSALAHTGAGPQHGLSMGIAHFFSGADHIVISILCGLTAAMATQRKNALLISLTFIIGFGLWHNVILFSGFELNLFDTGFMTASILTVMVAYAFAKLIKNTLRSRERM